MSPVEICTGAMKAGRIVNTELERVREDMRISIGLLLQAACSAQLVDSKLLNEPFSRISPCVLYGQLGKYAGQHIHIYVRG